MRTKTLVWTLLAVSGMAATSCQRESLAEMQLISEENITVYSVQYTIDGVPYAETLRSDEAYDALMQKLVALARNGCVVMVYDGNRQTSQLATKETIKFSTYSESEASSWSKRKTLEGYEVVITYDKKTKEFICIATR